MVLVAITNGGDTNASGGNGGDGIYINSGTMNTEARLNNIGNTGAGGAAGTGGTGDYPGTGGSAVIDLNHVQALPVDQ